MIRNMDIVIIFKKAFRFDFVLATCILFSNRIATLATNNHLAPRKPYLNYNLMEII